jgi:hypothetical protein
VNYCVAALTTLAISCACASGAEGDTPTQADNSVATLASIGHQQARVTTTTAPSGSVLTLDTLWELHDKFLDCLMYPDRCDPASMAVPGSPASGALESLMASRRSNGLRARPGPSPLTRRVFELRQHGSQAVARWCWVDDLVLIDDSMASGDVIVDDSEVTLAESWTLTEVGNRWRVYDRVATVTDRGGASSCS